MTISYRPLMLAFVLSVAAQSAARAADATVDSILGDYLQAIGGKAALEKVSSRVIKGTLEVQGLPEGSKWELDAKAPNKQLSVLDIAGMGMIQEGFDGTVSWSKNPFQGVKTKEGEELAKVKRDADFYRDLRFKVLYPNLALKGTEKVASEDAYVLEAKPAATGYERFYFSVKTGLLLKQASEFESSAGKVSSELTMSDVRTVDGLKYPHKMQISVTAPGQPQTEVTIKIQSIQHNQAQDDAKFAKPTS